MTAPTDRFPGHPMLAATAPELTALRFPIGVTGKVDGVRATCRLGKPHTRKLKLFPNRYFNHMFAMAADAGFNLDGIDGEIITDTDGVFVPGASNYLCNRTTSAVMTVAYTPKLRWYLFDIQPTPENGVSPTATFRERRAHLQRMMDEGRLPDWCELVPYAVCRSPEQIEQVERRWVLGDGLEGLVLRDLNAPYKFGRSTAKEQGLLRVTAWATAEALIIGAREAFENTNEGIRNEAGFLERSSTVDAKKALGRLGAWELRDVMTGVEFDCGTGFDHDMGKKFWEEREMHIGQSFVTYRFKPAGVKDKPRFPSFKAIRSPLDMS